MERLAIDGGQPVRSEPLPQPYLGTAVLGDEELALLTEVVRRKLPFREYGDGIPHMVKDFEREARTYFDSPYALATATGSGSFYCAMVGLGIGPGDEVLVPAFGWHTDYHAPVLAGAFPVFVDIDRSLSIDPDDFERKITPRTKACIIIHFQGAAGQLERLLTIARDNNVKVIEDCAQSAGATYRGRKLGSFGDVACFSFQQNKILSTGDGGLLLARDPVVFERAVRFHDLGQMRPSLASQLPSGTTQAPFAGCQFRMNEFTGAVALAQLRKLDAKVLSVTRKHFRFLKSSIASTCRGLGFRETGDDEGDAGIALHLDLGHSGRARIFTEALEAEGIRVGASSMCMNLLNSEVVQKQSMPHPALPPFGAGFLGNEQRPSAASPSSCPRVDRIISEMVAIAISPSYSDRDVRDIARAVEKVWQHIGIDGRALARFDQSVRPG